MSDFDAAFAEICSHLERAGKVKEISSLFSKCTNDRERVRFVINLNEVADVLSALDAGHDVTCGKRPDAAASHRAEGNAHFQKKDNRRALDAYNRSVLIADGESLALAYANRSAVFYDTEDWAHCLRDVQLAFDAGYPERLQWKLYERQGKCLLKLNDTARALASFVRAKQCCSTNGQLNDKLRDLDAKIESLETSTRMNCEVLSVKSIEKEMADARRKPFALNRERNPQMPSASKSVRLVHDPEKGRCLIAAEDLEPGTTVIAEKAFASILLDEFKSTHCHHCLHWTPAPVPCQRCAQVGFCSTTCRDEAGYHRAECGRRELFERANAGKHALLAVRTLHRLDNHDAGAPLDAKPCYDSSDYSTVRGLVTNAERRSVADLFRRAVLAVFLARIDAADDTETMASELLTLVQSYPCNAHEISEMCVPSGEPGTLSQGRLREIGAAAMPVLSLINHSCDPNVTRACFGDVICVTVIRRIARGDELLDNYGYHYATHERGERRLHLRRQYYFDCQCEACTLDWPLYRDIPRLSSANPQHLHLAKLVESHLEEFVHLPCRPDVLHPDKLLEYLITFARYLTNMERDLAIKRPVLEFNNCQEALKQCIGLLATLTPPTRD